MIRPVHCLAVRHAVPNLEPKDNPGINPSTASKVEGVGWALSTIFEDEGIHEAVIFCSPLRRAIETAERLSSTDSLKPYLSSGPLTTTDLAESTFEQMDAYASSLAWLPILSRLASTALAAARGHEVPSLILVTHEPVIITMPFLRNPNTAHLSINEFKTDVSIV